jgi:hypothetical protein
MNENIASFPLAKLCQASPSAGDKIPQISLGTFYTNITLFLYLAVLK